MVEIAAIVLAAGRSSRFAGAEPTKLVVEFGGKPLVRRVAEAALSSSARPVCVVTGHAREDVEEALRGLDLAFADNPDYASGLSGSLKCGLAALPADCAGAVVLLGDMPFVSAALIDRLVAAFSEALAAGTPPLAVAPVRAGARGNPVLIGRGLFPGVAALEGDSGARALIDAAGPRVIECAVEDDAALIDVDTAETLLELRGRFAARPICPPEPPSPLSPPRPPHDISA